MVPTPLILLKALSNLFKVVTDADCPFLSLEPDKLIFQRFNDGIKCFLVLRMEWMQSVTLSHQHRNQLASANHHRSKGLTFSIRSA